jgi:toxin CcdB
MARFDVYENPGKHAGSTPYLLDVQSDLLDELDTRMVVPLRHLEHFKNVELPRLLTPVFTVEGQEFLLETPKMGAVPRRLLKSRVTSLEEKRVQIMGALDFLFQGY